MRLDYETDDEFRKAYPAEAYRIRGAGGVAWRAVGWITEPGPTEWYDDELEQWEYDEEPEPVRTGRIACRMIGDDAIYDYEPDEWTRLVIAAVALAVATGSTPRPRP